MTVDRQKPHVSTTAGFTLVEMLVVLAIMGLVLGLGVPRLLQPASGLQLASTARALLGALRATRSAAIAADSETVLTIDVDGRNFASPAVGKHQFPKEIAATLTVAEPESESITRGGIRFFPDGSSTGGEIRLMLGGRKTRICVHWLTGQPVEDGTC